MKYKKYKNNDVYEIWSEQGQFMVSCTNEKTADYLISLLTPVNDNSILNSTIAKKNREILGKIK